ncbi:unnamed protein product, partial [Prorocentrum cordatum]
RAPAVGPPCRAPSRTARRHSLRVRPLLPPEQRRGGAGVCGSATVRAGRPGGVPRHVAALLHPAQAKKPHTGAGARRRGPGGADGAGGRAATARAGPGEAEGGEARRGRRCDPRAAAVSGGRSARLLRSPPRFPAAGSPPSIPISRNGRLRCPPESARAPVSQIRLPARLRRASSRTLHAFTVRVQRERGRGVSTVVEWPRLLRSLRLASVSLSLSIWYDILQQRGNTNIPPSLVGSQRGHVGLPFFVRRVCRLYFFAHELQMCRPPRDHSRAGAPLTLS